MQELGKLHGIININLLSTTPELFPAIGGYLYTPVLLAPGNSSGRKSRNGEATRPHLLLSSAAAEALLALMHASRPI